MTKCMHCGAEPVTVEIYGNGGKLFVHPETGRVERWEASDEVLAGDHEGYSDIYEVDMEMYRSTCAKHHIAPSHTIDIMLVGFWYGEHAEGFSQKNEGAKSGYELPAPDAWGSA